MIRVVRRVLEGCAYVQLNGERVTGAEKSVDGWGNSIWDSGWRGIWMDVEEAVYESCIGKGYQE